MDEEVWAGISGSGREIGELSNRMGPAMAPLGLERLREVAD
jgi:hypothetical protein